MKAPWFDLELKFGLAGNDTLFCKIIERDISCTISNIARRKQKCKHDSSMT